ncbi:hypothetical protein [Halostagnicola sp. A-GB9-2]|uniref:DUF7310 family coiled-coil domain-containing protein n=1 Tax=Halostagnicola sp. A-GB9-2 TaxID=3048066 RepID=UPI0024BF7D81|nr:hypothetical protein [Halostagnicola sp. A-GB9-2]MDJ1431024.1 hypothetical protein [Halostagnicola sp. A-GB9-2]
MSDFERLERRLAAVERALTESDRPVRDVPETAAIADDIDRLDEQTEELATRIAELEGSTQALRGYVGNVRSVNESVERRADSAVATVDRLERRVEALERATTDTNTTVLVSGMDTQTHAPPTRASEQREQNHLTHRRLGELNGIDHQQVEAQLAAPSLSDENAGARDSTGTAPPAVDGSSTESDVSTPDTRAGRSDDTPLLERIRRVLS